MNNFDLNEKLLEDILGYAFNSKCEQIDEDLPTENELSKTISTSKEFEERMANLISKQKNKVRMIYRLHALKKVAACFGIIIALNTVFLISVEAYRAQFFNMYISVKKQFSTFIFEEHGSDAVSFTRQIPDEWQHVYIPSFLPSGFLISDTISIGDIRRIIYTNEDTSQTINFSFCPLSKSTFSIDTENADTQKVNILTNQGYISEKELNGLIRVSLIWRNDAYVFTITTQLEKNMVIEIAESTKKIK